MTRRRSKSQSWPQSGSADGFTLIEVLVALAIFTLSVAVLFAIISTSLDRSRQVSDRAVAGLLLQSLLARAEFSQGVTTGLSPGQVRWRLDVEPYDAGGDAESNAGGDASLVTAVKITGSVSWKENGATQTRTQESLRVIPVSQ